MIIRRAVAMCAVVAVFTAGPALAARETEGRARPYDPHERALLAVEDCDHLRADLAQTYTEILLQNWYIPYEIVDVPWSQPGAGGAGAGDYSTTNVQEAGVDEPDLVKTDGNALFTVGDGRVHINDVWPVEAAHLVTTLSAEDAWPYNLLLYGDRLVVFENVHWDEVPEGFTAASRLRVFDVSDLAAPVELRSLTLEGQTIGARMIGGHLYTILSTHMPLPPGLWDLVWSGDLDLPDPPEDPDPKAWEAVLAEARALLLPEVEAVVATMSMEDLLPALVDEANGAVTRRAIASCEDVLRPLDADQESLLSVVHLDLNRPDVATAVVSSQTIMASAWTIYASTASLYVARSTGGWWGWLWGTIWPHAGSDEPSVEIHCFALDPDGDDPVRYTATGTAPGRLLDQFSFGEHEGYLRVATGPGWGWEPDVQERGSTVTVLRDDGAGVLRQVGQVEGIARGEDLYASRFLGDRGYLVTFERIDPLFTLDLSEPADPRIAGELKIPGFSTYLHPMADGEHLLAVGREGDDDGRVFGLAVKVFDVGDIADPRVSASLSLGTEDEGWSWSEALSDHHAFTYHRDVLAIPTYHDDGWSADRFAGLIAFDVAPEGDHLAELGRVDHMDLPDGPSNPWSYLHLPVVRRSVVLEDYLVSISRRGLKITLLRQPGVEVGRVEYFGDIAPLSARE